MATKAARRNEVFSTAEDSQPSVDVVVLQGERPMARDNRQLGRFKLEGIRPAPRGMPQIEVSFDIDANGILNATARDKDTGKEQNITISGSTNLDKSEIDRMVHEAETHAARDKEEKELAEERNEADTLAYQVEKAIADLGDKVPVHEKARCEQLITEIRLLEQRDWHPGIRQVVGKPRELFLVRCVEHHDVVGLLVPLPVDGRVLLTEEPEGVAALRDLQTRTDVNDAR